MKNALAAAETPQHMSSSSELSMLWPINLHAHTCHKYVHDEYKTFHTRRTSSYSERPYHIQKIALQQKSSQIIAARHKNAAAPYRHITIKLTENIILPNASLLQPPRLDHFEHFSIT